jgi:hypothetical protein
MDQNDTDKKDYKALLIAKVKEANPEADINDDNIFEHLHNYDEGRSGHYAGMEKSLKDFTDLIGNNDYASGFIAHLGAGGHPLDYIIDNWDGDVQELLNDPDRKEKFEAGIQAKKAAMTSADQTANERRENMYKSMDILVKLLDPTLNLDVLNDEAADEAAKQPEMEKLDAINEKVEKAVDFAQQFAESFTSGEITSDQWNFILKALSYDKDMSDASAAADEAAAAAEIRAKNGKAKITLRKIASSEKNNEAPNLGGQGQGSSIDEPQKPRIKRAQFPR